LARFDGQRFTVYDESNTKGLASSQIVKLFEDNQRNLWLGTETAGAALIRNGVVIPLDIGRGSREGRLIHVCQDAQGAVWLGTADGRVLRQWDNQIGELNLERFGPTRSIIADANGQVWRAAERGFFLLRAASDGTVEATPSGSFNRFDYLLASKTGGYWRIADGQIQKWTTHGMEASLGAYPWPANTTITTACEDWKGGLVVGTLLHGLYWLDKTGKSVCLSTNDGLSNNNILSLQFYRLTVLFH